MGMSTHVYGIKPPDDDWVKMKAVYDAYSNAGIELPVRVENYFDGETPDPKGVVLYLDPQQHDAVSEYQDQHRSGYDIDITKLHPDIKIVRVVNSW